MNLLCDILAFVSSFFFFNSRYSLILYSLFQSYPLRGLSTDTADIEKIIENFENYKSRVPVCGAIILNEALDKVNFENP